MSSIGKTLPSILIELNESVFRQLRVLDLVECYLEEDEEEGVDWISRFPRSVTCLESLVFECLSGPVNFEALESLVARSPNLRQLRLNQEVSAAQLQRLMAGAPLLTHLGTGSFKSAAAAAGGPAPQGADNEVETLTLAFAASRSIVCLSGFRDLSPELLPAIYPVCANLTSLNFSFAEINPEQLRPVILHCHNLQKFWVLNPLINSELYMPFWVIVNFVDWVCFHRFLIRFVMRDFKWWRGAAKI